MHGEHGSMDAHDGCQDARTLMLQVQKSRNLDTIEIISASTSNI
jgi:hypothetical protein